MEMVCVSVGVNAASSDEALLEGLLQKEPGAWREFHRRYDRLVYRCIHKVTSRFPATLSSEDAREIHSHLLLSLNRRDMHKLRTFDAERGNKLSTWIGMLATNAAWDYLRGVSRQPSCTDLTHATDVREPGADPFDRVLERELWRHVDRTLQAFSAKDQVFVRLYYLDGLSPEEVAEEMSISIKTVYSKKHKIRSRLERMLQPLFVETAAA